MIIYKYPTFFINLENHVIFDSLYFNKKQLMTFNFLIADTIYTYLYL